MARRNAKRRVAEKNVITERGKYSSKYALSELLQCGDCGTRYRRVTWARKGKIKIVWRCINRLEYGTKYCKIPVEKRVYIDECGINQCLVREYGRSPRGVKIEDTKRGRKFERTNVISARVKNKSGEIAHALRFAILKTQIVRFLKIGSEKLL